MGVLANSALRGVISTQPIDVSRRASKNRAMDMTEDRRRTRREQLDRYLEGVQKGEADLALQADLELTNAAFAHLK